MVEECRIFFILYIHSDAIYTYDDLTSLFVVKTETKFPRPIASDPLTKTAGFASSSSSIFCCASCHDPTTSTRNPTGAVFLTHATKLPTRITLVSEGTLRKNRPTCLCQKGLLTPNPSISPRIAIFGDFVSIC